MGLIMDRNGRDLTEAEDIKKRWQEMDVSILEPVRTRGLPIAT